MNTPRRYRNAMPPRLTASPDIEEVTLTGRRSWPTVTVPVTLVPTGTTEIVGTTVEHESFRAALAATLEGEVDPATLATELTTLWARLSEPGKRRVAELFQRSANRVEGDLNSDT